MLWILPPPPYQHFLEIDVSKDTIACWLRPRAEYSQWKQQLQLYEQHVEQLEDHIRQLITTHQGLNRYYQLLLTIPGIGKVTAWLWLVLFYGHQTSTINRLPRGLVLPSTVTAPAHR